MLVYVLATYADLMEHTLYNAVIPGISLEGQHYFYQNPLADRGKHRRQAWFGCACCPPNIARLLASLPGYFYSTKASSVWVHLYATGTATLPLPDGGSITLEQKTNYPWDGEIEITVTQTTGHAEFLCLRIPEWVEGSEIRVNGELLSSWDSYVEVSIGGVGTKVTLSLPMEVKRLVSHPHVLGNLGRVALQRGPLIYCLEQADHSTDVWDITLPASAELTPEFVPGLLGGVTVLKGQGIAYDHSSWEGTLTRPASANPPSQLVPITAIPYYAWANREAGPMQVWIPSSP